MTFCVLSLGLVATYNPLEKPTRRCREINRHVSPTTPSARIQASTLITRDYKPTKTPVLKALPAKIIEANQTLPQLCNSASCQSAASSLVSKNIATNYQRMSATVVPSVSATPTVNQSDTHNRTLSKSPVSAGVRYFSLIGLILFVASYSFSFGPVSWLLLSEIFPTGIKGRAFSIATVLNWGTNLVVSFTFLDLLSK